MNLKYLTLMEGFSSESIETKLKEAKIEYHTSEKYKEPYFKASTLDLAIKYPLSINKQELTKIHKTKIIELLGFPNFFKLDSYFYVAKYKIKSNFDISQLHNKITFDNGLLIESTRIIL